MLSTKGYATYVYPAPTDLRKGFSGLSGLVEERMAMSLLGEAIFVFVNRRRNALKLLHFDGLALTVVHRKLQKGRFPRVWDLGRQEGGRVRLTHLEFSMLMEGGDLVSHVRDKRR